MGSFFRDFRKLNRDGIKLLFIFLLVLAGLIISVNVIGEGSTTAISTKLELVKAEVVSAGYGLKAVVMNSYGSKVYTMNLEAMSVYEFDRNNRKIQRKLVFAATPGKGFDYDKKVWFNSYQEKPVEGYITHNGRYLWISLHNAGGMVIWDLEAGDTYVEGQPFKKATLYERDDTIQPVATPGSKKTATADPYKKREVKLLLIKTGVTPKVITITPDGKYLFVANWHSNNVSVIEISSSEPKDWVKVRDIGPNPIPRGMAVTPDSKFLYIGQMGGDYISVIDLETFKTVKTIRVGVNPRHLVLHNGYIYSSLNIASKLIKLDLITGKVVKTVNTLKSPRTVAISGDGKVLFVSCYTGNSLQAFSTEDLTLLGTFPSTTHPVAVEAYQDGDTIEAWVGNQSSGTLKVFTFREK